MASWVLVQQGTDINSAGASPRTVTLPSNLSGDLMIAGFPAYSGNLTPQYVTVTTGGWTQVGSNINGLGQTADTTQLAVWAKISTGSEANLAYTVGGSCYTDCGMVVFRPGTTTTAVNVDGLQSGTSANSSPTSTTLGGSWVQGALTDLDILFTTGYNVSVVTGWGPVNFTQVDMGGASGTYDGVNTIWFATDLASTTIGTESAPHGASTADTFAVWGIAFAFGGGAVVTKTPYNPWLQRAPILAQ